MSAPIKHFIYIPFTGVGIPGYKGDTWFKDRIEIFKNYTLKSLQNQTNKNFTVWLSFRPEEQNNPEIATLLRVTVSSGLSFVFTFSGLMYHDDKFSTDLFSRIKNCFRLVRHALRSNSYSDLLSNLKLVWHDKNSTLLQRLAEALPKLGLIEEDMVLLTRIDSDDMFHQDYVQIVQEHIDWAQVSLCSTGYIYNTTTGELATWEPDTNPPFHTIVFINGEFTDPQRHLTKYKDFRSHEDIPRIFPVHNLLKDRYCVTTHNPKNHISTTWNHPFRGSIITDQSKEEILKSFGL